MRQQGAAMSDTPRTDAAWKKAMECYEPALVMLGCSEQLERDLAAAIRERDECKDKLHELCGVDNYLLATQCDKLQAKLDSISQAATIITPALSRIPSGPWSVRLFTAGKWFVLWGKQKAIAEGGK